METFEFTRKIEVYECAECGIPFGVPTNWANHKRDGKKNVWCPNGHTLSYNQNQSRAEMEAELGLLRQERANLKTQNAGLLAKVDQLEAKLASLTGSTQIDEEGEV